MQFNFENIVDKLSKSISSDHDYLSNDITVCVAIRLAEVNPWVLERLDFMLSFYNPSPSFLVIDFGSEEEYANEIKQVCDKRNAQYRYVNDKDSFSASRARNLCLNYVETELMFFTDVDVIHNSDFFGRLAVLANDLDVSSAIRRGLFMPVYHLSEEASSNFLTLSDKEKNKALRVFSSTGQRTEFKEIFDFVAPYSNIFLIHRDFFDLSGGYCDLFRGHGSEDFDFLIRLGILSENLPLPELLNKDFFGPLKSSFWGIRDYTGFRRYLESITATSESLGLNCFHIWHDKPKGQGYWSDSNDWKRDTFNEVVSTYYPKIENIINVDFHERESAALCLFNDVKSWGYFIPLRLHGYQLTAVTAVDDTLLNEIYNDLERGKYNRVFIFNPYMKSHAKYRGILEVAKKLGIQVTVIERGGLPKSVYYADEVVYGNPEYKQLSQNLAYYQPVNLALTREIIATLRKGEDCLESQDTYEETWKRNVLSRIAAKPVFFIPLQLSEDMAVTRFNDGYTTYDNFYNEIIELAERYQECIFLVKQHPLSNDSIISDLDNLVIVDSKDNIHCLIDISSAVFVYNSGVGLLSCLHGKTTFNVGNSYYSDQGLSNQVTSLDEAVQRFLSDNYNKIDLDFMESFFDWLIFKKYSWFSADSTIRDFGDRKSHGYSNIMIEILNLDGTVVNSGSRISQYSYSNKSYLGWKTNINFPQKKSEIANKSKIQAEAVVSSPTAEKNIKDTISSSNLTSDTFHKRLVNSVFSVFLNDKEKRKLANNPTAFFTDSKSSFSKMFRKNYIN